jgi:6-phosphogluconolactonase (cycloisomerase 2 family)
MNSKDWNMRLSRLRSSISISRGPSARLIAAALFSALLAACGGGDGSGNSVGYNVSATVSNLQAGTSVVLLNNGGDSLTVSANGTVAFATPVASGGAYSVTVATQPRGQTCNVSQGIGTVSSFNINVAVACTATAYQIGGTVSGLLSGNGVMLQNNSTNSATVNANGTFVFSSTVLSGSAYAVTVVTQPTGQTCTIANGSGTIAGANISNVLVNCASNSYTISASVTGLANVTGLVLQDNATDNLPVTSGGSYPFQTRIPSRGTYSVTILTQPAGHICIVQNGSGTVATTNVTVSVVCPQYILYSMGSGVAAFYIDETTGSLVPVLGGTCPLGTIPIVFTPNGKFAYVAGGSGISVCSSDPITGALTTIAGSPYAPGGSSIAITPNGNLVFVLTSGSSVSSFNVNASTGALTAATIGPIAVSAGSTVIAIDPTGQFAYVLGNSITAYTIDYTTGGLTPIANGSISNGGIALVFDPVGGFVYVSGTISSIFAYTLDPTTGLNAVSGSPFAGPLFPQGLAVSPNGQFLYVAGQAEDAALGYSVNSSTGALTPLTGNPFGGGYMPEGVAVDPTGKFAYLANSSSIGIYSIDAARGALSLVNTQEDTMSGYISPFVITSVQ